MKKIKLIISICVATNFIFISKIISQNVNEFTGGFSYSTPLMTVPSPYGPGASIGASYGAGIGVNQSASEIGLGWEIYAGGVISRNVSGVPDDWFGATVADPLYGGFKSQGGVMCFKNGTSYVNMDFYKSTYKIDTPAFYFPDYDNYSISGPGIGGSLQPHLFDFESTQLVEGYTTNLPATSYTIGGFTKKMEFNFAGDYAGNFKSRHYPTTPISSGTTLRLPGDRIQDTEYPGAGGIDIPYVGVGNVGYNLDSNRLATAKYVEYFSNTQLNSLSTSNALGFMNLPSSINRTSTDYEMDGIGAFRVTDESGFVYYYTQPAYINSATFGNYPLNNDYSIKAYVSSDTTRRSSNGNYFIRDNALTTDTTKPFMVEWKQNKRYAYNWLLTAVTGPDYIDSNTNGIVDDGDKGYWLSYDWQLWTKNFNRRSPEYGFNYSFSADENDNTQDKVVTDAHKISGKFASFSKYNQEIYYLNKIHTASHTAVMVRDVCLDGFSSNSKYDDVQFNNINNMPAGSGTATYTSNIGTLYDDGGVSGNYTNSCTSKVTISPSGASSITVKFNVFIMYDINDVVKVLDASDNVLATYSTSNIPPATGATFNYSTIKIQEYTNASNVASGFSLGWSSGFNTIPKLKVSRVVLFTNDDFATLNTPSSSSAYYVSTSVTGLDVSSAGKDKFYNETWYNHTNNKSNIESKSLQTVEFNQDYSLAKNYVNNIKTNVLGTNKLSSPTEVVNAIYSASGDYASSGKLTLNEITTYNVGHIKTSPSVQFDYNKSVSTDNPDYNPVKIDYSGYYKKDASAQGYSSYTTDTSALYSDAWSMRKITDPMGGTIEINYESNKYEKVLDGNGGFRGPSKMYSIKSISLPASYMDYGSKWGYTMEEDVTEPSDFTALKSSPPSGTIQHVDIPFISDPIVLNAKLINSGTFTFSSSPVQLTGIDSLFISAPMSPTPIDNHYSFDPYETYDASYLHFTDFTNKLFYTGNGYIHFDLPIGSAVNAGGIRVKSIVTKNGTTDAYTKEYTYSGGVTPMEFDRFAEEKKKHNNSYAWHNVKLRPAAYDHHRMGPGIGYSQVTVKEKGQNNTANGSTVYNFITSDTLIDNFKTRIQLRTNSFTCTGCSSNPTAIDTSYIIEVVDKFSGYWGQVKDLQSLDINNNIVSRTVNTYSNTDQGSIVENFNFETDKNKVGCCSGGPCPGPANYTCDIKHNIICIKRNYPVILTQQTVYGQGISATTEYLAFDPVTSAITKMRKTTPNGGITVIKTTPAFRVSQFAAMGPKSVDPANANIVSPTAYSKTTIDSTLSKSSDFANCSVQTFMKNYTIRKYDSGTGMFINDAQTNLSWIADRSYNWAGDSSSLDNYGLLKQSQLTSAPFDYTLASIDSKWRFASQNTLLDKSGHVLEMKGFNDRFSAKKYGYGETLPIAQASNTNFQSFTFCGFESPIVNGYADGEVKMNDGSLQGGGGHTGTYSVYVPAYTDISTCPSYSVKYNSTNENSGLLKGRTYRISVWMSVYNPDESQLTVTTSWGTYYMTKGDPSNITIGNWVLVNLDIAVPSTLSNGNELKVSLDATWADSNFDDLRIHPVDANMSATVYEPKTNRVAATLDGNNFATIYKYDAAGRVIEVWQEIEGIGLKKMKKYQYNYARGLN